MGAYRNEQLRADLIMPSLTVHQGVGSESRFLTVADPLLGDWVVDDQEDQGLTRSLLSSPAAHRLLGISHFGIDETAETIPDVSSYTHWDHLLRKSGLTFAAFRRDRNIDGRQQLLACQLHNLLQSARFSLFSRSLELLLQPSVQSEADQYKSLRQSRAAELGGIARRLSDRGYGSINTITAGFRLPGWLVAQNANVSIPSFAYSATEASIWFRAEHEAVSPAFRQSITEMTSMDNLVVTDKGELAFTDRAIALLWAKSYLLQSMEHWNEPTHRLIVALIGQAAMHSIVQRRFGWLEGFDAGFTYRPEDYFHGGVDEDLTQAMRTSPNDHDQFMLTVTDWIESIAAEARKRHIITRLAEYAYFLSNPEASALPTESYVQLWSSTRLDVQALPADSGLESAPQLRPGTNDIVFDLAPLPYRTVNPLVMHRGSAVALSDIDSAYQSLLRHHKQISSRGFSVQIAANADAARGYRQDLLRTTQAYAGLTRRPLMSAGLFERLIMLSAERARSSAQANGRLKLPEEA